MPIHLKVDLGERSYDIRIGEGLLEELGPSCKALGLGGSGLVVSDSNVDALYGGRAEDSLRKAGFAVRRAVVPAGETSKSQEQLFALLHEAVSGGLDRGAFIVALGGGVVGDLAGFAAAIFLRGVRYVQVPTSLLAMVDSSVGGKTGINLAEGKNLVGAFHQPVLVLADSRTLKTLPPREYTAGLAEVVKHGVIRDAKLFAELEAKADAVAKGDPAVLDGIIARCCGIKAEVVHLDERETGLRAILNFGHTVGHAIEQVAGYGKYLHGEAIAMGMVVAGRLSAKLKGFGREEQERLEALLKALGLPTAVPDRAWKEIRAAMGVDKKGTGGTPRFVLAERLGHVVPGCEVPEDLLAEVWQEVDDVGGK